MENAMQPFRFLNAIRLKRRVLALQIRNYFSRVSATGATPVVVSVTTHGERLDRVWLTLESVAQGTCRPNRIILWLDQANRNRNIGRQLQRLRDRGVEIFYENDLGPHTKYYHAIDVCVEQKMPLVTVDDDVLYTKNWLKDLYQEYQRTPMAIVCHRARMMCFDPCGRLISYDSWPLVGFAEAHPCVFLTGVSGVVYPVKFLEKLKQKSTSFMETCPKADDIWLNYIAALTKTEVRQCRDIAVDFAISPASQSSALWDFNRTGGNDKQIIATYDSETLRRLYCARLQ